MSGVIKWNFTQPGLDNPGECVFSLVVFENREIGVTCIERGRVRSEWNSFAFAWAPIDYPGFTIFDVETVLDKLRSIPRPLVDQPGKGL